MNVPDAVCMSRADPFDLAMEDGAGCLAHLLRAPTREGCTVADLARGRAVAGLSDRALRSMGVAMEPVAGSRFFAVAASHPALVQIYAPTFWIGDWASALLTLPGAVRASRKMLVLRLYAPAILLPRSLLVEAAS